MNMERAGDRGSRENEMMKKRIVKRVKAVRKKPTKLSCRS
jgi:hypothetical protein